MIFTAVKIVAAMEWHVNLKVKGNYCCLYVCMFQICNIIFFLIRFCSDTCEEATSKRRAAIGRRAIELEELRLKRRRRRQKEIRLRQKGRLLPGGTVESGDDSPSSSPEFPEDADKAGTPATTATPNSTAQNSPSQSPANSEDEANSSDGQVVNILFFSFLPCHNSIKM